MSNGASDESIAAYAAQLLDLEADLEATQGAKKDVYTNARETYGKRFADSLKLAIKRHRMDTDKRDAADEIDAEAERMLSIISRPSAPRATHAREIIEEFDAETGEVLETSSQRQPRKSRPTVATEAATAANVGGDHEYQGVAEIPIETVAEPDVVASALMIDETVGRDGAPYVGPVSAVEPSAPIPPPAEGNTPTSAGHGDESATHAAALVVADNVVPIKKRWTFSDPAHRDCLDPVRCGGFSNLKLCQRCSEAADQGQVA